MAITFREAVAEVELGLVSSDQLPDIATAGLIEGYESQALTALAAQFGEPYDPVGVERLWTDALDELDLPLPGRLNAAKILVRAYARLVADGELPPQLGASKIVGVHKVACHTGCINGAEGDCIGARAIIDLFLTHDDRGYFIQGDRERIDDEIVAECRRLAELPA